MNTDQHKPDALITEKLYSPLFVQIHDYENEDNYGGDYWSDPVSQQVAIYYERAIHIAILRERMPDELERGLMTYYHDGGSVDEKVRSLLVDVEVHDEKLWGVATIKLTEPLTSSELDLLKDYLSGQYSDGFGEGFEQREIKVEDGELYVSLWDSGDRFFIDTEQEFQQRLWNKAPIVEPQSVISETPAQAALHEPDIYDSEQVVSLREQLLKRLDENLANFFSTLRATDVQALCDMTTEIAAVTSAHYYLSYMFNFHSSELEYLLKFKDPLSVVADEFQLEAEIENHSAVMWNIFDKQDALQGDYELVSDNSGEAALRLELFDRLDKNLSDYRESILDYSKQDIFDTAEDIVARSAALEYLEHGYDYNPGEVEYLLRFQDPLSLIAEGWPATTDGLVDMSGVIADTLEDRSSHGNYALVSDASFDPVAKGCRLEDAATDKPSVLARLRQAEQEKRSNPAAPKKMSDRKIPGQEL